MNILLLEDKGVAACYLREVLEEEGHTVFLAQNISKAKTYCQKYPIGCIIADLNMRPDGLKSSEAEQTNGGLLSGWVWLQNYVFNKDESMKKRTIILTAYIGDLRNNVDDAQLEGVTLIAKNPLDSTRVASKTILDFVKEIEKRIQNEASDAGEN